VILVDVSERRRGLFSHLHHRSVYVIARIFMSSRLFEFEQANTCALDVRVSSLTLATLRESYRMFQASSEARVNYTSREGERKRGSRGADVTIGKCEMQLCASRSESLGCIWPHQASPSSRCDVSPPVSDYDCSRDNENARNYGPCGRAASKDSREASRRIVRAMIAAKNFLPETLVLLLRYPRWLPFCDYS